MIVCSCNNIDTAMIKAAANFVHEPNEKLVLNMLNWKPECAICSKVIIEEIRKVFKEINNQSLIEGDDDYGC